MKNRDSTNDGPYCCSPTSSTSPPSSTIWTLGGWGNTTDPLFSPTGFIETIKSHTASPVSWWLVRISGPASVAPVRGSLCDDESSERHELCSAPVTIDD